MQKRSSRIVKQKHSFGWRSGSRRDFPGYRSLLLADSLYASKQVMELCREYKWEFLIRYKKGSIPSIAEEYEKIPEKGKTEKAEFVNEIDYEGKPVHVLRYREEKEGEITEFQWLCSIKISKENAEKWRKQEGNAGR